MDAAITALAFTLAITVRRWMTQWRTDVFPPFDALWTHAWLYVMLIPLWVFLLDFAGFYQHRMIRKPAVMLRLLARANLFGLVLTFFILYVLKIKHIPRVLVLLFAAFHIVLMWLKELLIQRFEPLWTERLNLVLVGRPAELEGFRKKFAQMPSWKVRVLGMLVPATAREEDAGGGTTAPEQPPVLGTTEELRDLLHRESVDCVVLSPSREHFDEIQKTIELCETEGVEVWLSAEFFRTRIASAHVDELLDEPMLVFSTTPALSWALLLKRVMDAAGSLFLILLFAPLMLAAAAAIKLTSPGPVLFRQRRCTLHSRQFWMYKFRTMVTEAENLRSELQGRNEMNGPVFKIRDDPRVTRVGRFLRRHSLDELPQLFNVLVGQMSLVGPRPPVPSEVAKYESWQRRRLSMRSGITCLWQISGRNEVDFDDWMRLDLEYIDHWSLGLDMKVLLRTPVAVVKGTGF